MSKTNNVDAESFGRVVLDFCEKNNISLTQNLVNDLGQIGNRAQELKSYENEVKKAIEKVVSKGDFMMGCPTCGSHVLLEYEDCPACGTSLMTITKNEEDDKKENKGKKKQDPKDVDLLEKAKEPVKPENTTAPPTEELKKMPNKDLKFIAKEFGLSPKSKANKTELLNLILEFLGRDDDIIDKKDTPIKEVEMKKDQDMDDEEIEEEADEEDLHDEDDLDDDEEIDDDDDDDDDDDEEIDDDDDEEIDDDDDDEEVNDDDDDEEDLDDDDDEELDDEDLDDDDDEELDDDDDDDEEIDDDDDSDDDLDDDDDEEEIIDDLDDDDEEEEEKPKKKGKSSSKGKPKKPSAKEIEAKKKEREAKKKALEKKIPKLKKNPKLVDKLSYQEVMMVLPILGVNNPVKLGGKSKMYDKAKAVLSKS